MVIIFVASLNENLKLAKRIETHLTHIDIESKIVKIPELELPMYSTQKEQDDGIPQVATTLAKEMLISKGYIFVAPEYNYAPPPTLLNMIAWISRIGDDFRDLFVLKTILLATHSGGGGDDLLNSMRVIFTRLGGVVAPREILTSYKKSLSNESLDRILAQFKSLL
ncbi:MAG: NAD(P)H-dependent oxidoreductase [Sulfurimonas sp.]|jgi:NAD(P)H-dependent FMN reductase|nr:NAD(P)H-dependent oxidoreductase [Sulfurimonadaceae bacterium]